MDRSDTNLILISGPVGVGKTSVGEELSTLLEASGTAHTFVDLDGLAKTYPRPKGDRFGEQIALANLEAVWRYAFNLGTRNLIVARVVETREGANRIARAVGADSCLIVQLTAREEILLRRVRSREIGSGRVWHENRALELADILERSDAEDIRVDTSERPVGDIANDLFQSIEWI